MSRSLSQTIYASIFYPEIRTFLPTEKMLSECVRVFFLISSSAEVVIHLYIQMFSINLTWRMVQVTCQDVSTMMRQEQNSIIFLINNGGYTIEVEIHDGPYNVIKNWSYTGFVDAIHNGEGKVWTTKVFFLQE